MVMVEVMVEGMVKVRVEGMVEVMVEVLVIKTKTSPKPTSKTK